MKLFMFEGLKTQWEWDRRMGAVRGKFKYVTLSTPELMLGGTIIIWYKKGQGTLKEMVCLCATEQLTVNKIFTRKFLST